MLNMIRGYILNTLDINHRQSLGLGVHPAAPRLSSEREFRTQGGPLVSQWEGFPFAAC